MFSTTFSPLVIVILFLHGNVDITLPVLLGTLFFMPLAVVAHELGHACVGGLLGLEIGGISIGHGKLLWSFRVRSVPVRVHLAPVSGKVYFGAETTALLRTRLWFSVLAGPLTNILLLVATGFWWRELEPIFGNALILIWVVVNVILLLTTLLPHHGVEAGQPYRSDGLQLWELPRTPDAKLSVYRRTVPIMRALFFFEARDYERSRSAAERILDSGLDGTFARIMISGSNSNLGEHQRTVSVLEPLMKSVGTLGPHERAVVRNNVAFARFMLSAGGRDRQSLEDAEQFSAEAFGAYPCTLAYRSTRALILVAMGRESEALELLSYVHYEWADTVSRSHRDGVRAFALQRLGRAREAHELARGAVRVNPLMGPVLDTLGVSGARDF